MVNPVSISYSELLDTRAKGRLVALERERKRERVNGARYHLKVKSCSTCKLSVSAVLAAGYGVR